MKISTNKLSEDAELVLKALKCYGWNTRKFLAGKCGLSYINFDMALDELEDHGYPICRGIRKDSYGVWVIWLGTKEEYIETVGEYERE